MIKLGFIDISALLQQEEQDSQVIIKALLEEAAEKDMTLKGAMHRIEGLETVKAIYLNTVSTLMEELEQYKLQEQRLILQLQKRDEQIRELKQNSRAAKYFEMAEENLKLAQEVHRLKGAFHERGNNRQLS